MLDCAILQVLQTSLANTHEKLFVYAFFGRFNVRSNSCNSGFFMANGSSSRLFRRLGSLDFIQLRVQFVAKKEAKDLPRSISLVLHFLSSALKTLRQFDEKHIQGKKPESDIDDISGLFRGLQSTLHKPQMFNARSSVSTSVATH
jgi:hypothetical protein